MLEAADRLAPPPSRSCLHRRRDFEAADVHAAARRGPPCRGSASRGVVDRDRRVGDVVRRAQQPALLAGERDEHQGARKPRALSAAATRAISMTAEVPDALSSAPLWICPSRSGRHRQVAAEADVVVVRADDDGFWSRRVGVAARQTRRRRCARCGGSWSGARCSRSWRRQRPRPRHRGRRRSGGRRASSPKASMSGCASLRRTRSTGMPCPRRRGPWRTARSRPGRSGASDRR